MKGGALPGRAPCQEEPDQANTMYPESQHAMEKQAALAASVRDLGVKQRFQQPPFPGMVGSSSQVLRIRI